MSALPSEFAGTDRFVVLRQLGAGGMGVVYEALDRERDIRVALKILPNVNPPALLRFKQEFRSLAAIVHPNLVPLYELISNGDLWFFTMEIIDGRDFFSYLRSDFVLDRNDQRQVPSVDEQRLRRAFYQLGLGVAAIHAGGKLH